MAEAYQPEFPASGGAARAREPETPLEAQRSTAEIVKDIVGNIQEIIRSEIRLATAEIKQKMTQAAQGGIAMAAGAITGLYAVGFLLVAVYSALTYAIWPWLAAVIVAVALGLGAGVMIAAGRKRFRQFSPKPEQMLESVKEDIAWIKNRKR